jgi:hypothetical protein
MTIEPKKSCQECHQHEFLYQCPRCSFRSCSLACCQAHKKQTGCNGKRDRTGVFMPMGRMDDSTVNSDYHFLEDVLGQVESGKRLLRQVGEAASAEQAGQANAKRQRREQETSTDNDGNEATVTHPLIQSAEASVAARLPGLAVQQPATTATHSKSPQQHAHPKWRHFEQQCTNRGVKLLLMPPGLERHKSNKSHLKKDVLYWTVEWRIHETPTTTTTTTAIAATESTTPKESSTLPPARVLLSKISEQTIVRQAIQQVEPSEKASSTNTADSEDVKDWSNYSLLLKRLPCPSHQPFYVEISDTSTLATALKDMTVIEYPTIEVVPASRSAEFPLAIQDVSEQP